MEDWWLFLSLASTARIILLTLVRICIFDLFLSFLFIYLFIYYSICVLLHGAIFFEKYCILLRFALLCCRWWGGREGGWVVSRLLAPAALCLRLVWLQRDMSWATLSDIILFLAEDMEDDCDDDDSQASSRQHDGGIQLCCPVSSRPSF